MTKPLTALCALLSAVALSSATDTANAADIPRTPDGRPDLSGTYDITTATPLQRRRDLGTRKTLTDAEARGLAARITEFIVAGNAASDPDRSPPPAGGDVGSYNIFFVDIGSSAIQVDGEYRTSILVDPSDGRIPPTTEAADRRAAVYDRSITSQPGAWWLDVPGPGPFDHPESLTTVDRCLTGRGVPAGPPVLPTIYNNLKRIVQTPDHVMILIEMVHDARIIRLNSAHLDPSIRNWYGDSIGWWEGDTLVVDTTNFNDTPSLVGASRDLHVVERFQRVDEDTLLYSFTVEDPNSWEGAWSGEYPWPHTTDLLYEYACHEANYAMRNILSSARTLEREAQAAPRTESE